MPIKTWLIWFIGSTIWFSVFANFSIGLSILTGLIFTVLAEVIHRMFLKISGEK
jgi:hypothetical protein